MPPIVAIALALLTKEVYLSLFAGCALGALLAAEFHPWIAFDTLFNTMIDSVDFSILMFMILLGMIVMLMQESGGTRAYGEWASGHLKSKRSALVTTSLLGALIFVDDYFNCLTVGSVMRPVTDKYKVSRAKLAYIIDATAAPVCIIAPISSWAAAVNSYVPAGSSMSGFEMFVKTIPFNLYAILTLYMVFFTSIVGFDFGLMKKHEENAAKGDLFTSGGEEFQNQETKDPTEGGKYAKGKVIDLIAPMVVMIATAIAAMIWTGHLNGGQNLVEDFANCSSSEAFDNTKLIGHYYEREKGAPLIVFFHGLWGHSYLDGVPIYRITQKHNWNLLLCDLRAQGDSEGKFSTLGVLEKYDCLDWVEWAQNRFGDKNPIFLMGVSMGASIVMMSSDLELPDSVYGIIDDCGFTSTLDVIKQNNNKQISKYIPKNLFPTMLNVGTKIWGSFDLSDADACKALAHTDIPLLIIHGDEDMQAPLSMAYKLYDSCNGEKQLYIVHGADHSENYRKDPGGYEKIVTKFIEERIERKDD